MIYLISYIYFANIIKEFVNMKYFKLTFFANSIGNFK